MKKDPKQPAKTAEPKSQVEKFRELARKIGADESEEPLNEAIRKAGGGVRRWKPGGAKAKESTE